MASDNGESTPPPSAPPIKHGANRELVTVVANLLVEAKQHTVGLHTLYEALRDWPDPVPRLWGHRFLDEYERHMERENEHLVTLRSVVGR